MSKTTIEKIILAETKDLSDDELKAILDFILFLKDKEKTKSSFENKVKDDLEDLDKTSLNHLEAEFFNYKEHFPIEK